MVTNPYFNNFQASNEQLLIEDLIIESIKIYGHDVYYLPRTLDNKDKIYAQSDLVSYNSAYMVEMYIESFDGSGFAAESNFLSKFNLEIRNQVTFSIAQRVFEDDVNQVAPENLVRPREGDLIFFPLNGRVFQIMYVDKFQMFYQLGALQTWKMTCELFEYSSESFNTGIAEIDVIEQKTFNILDWALLDEEGAPLLTEDNNYIVTESFDNELIDPMDDANQIQTESDVFVDFSVIDPFSDGNI